jgi:ribonuclease D
VDQKETYQFIDTDAALRPLLTALGRVKEAAIDTEADNLFRYSTRVCLLQILAGDEVFLVDLLAPIDFAPLFERFAKMHLLMHGSDYDLRLLHDEYGFVASSMFDTMLAAQLLNRQRIGLASLLHEHFGVAMTKEGQKANWSRRPIPPKLLDYAVRDVLYLPRLRDQLSSELESRGRLGWLKEKCDWQIQAALSGFPKADENNWRIGRSEVLSRRGQATLYDLWHWREAQAERLDVPPFKVVGNELLLTLAKAADRDNPWSVFDEIRLGKRIRLISTLQAAFRAGLNRDPASLPRRQRRFPERGPLTADELERQDRIKRHRDRIASELDLDPTLIASRAQLTQLAREPAKLGELLLPFQASLLNSVPDFAEAAL